MPGSTLRLSGDLDLLKCLGSGGMGEVYQARYLGAGGLTRTVVVKRILPRLQSDVRFTEMLLHEARLTAQLAHPCIVQILGIGQQDGSYFIAMEYVSGRPLNEIIFALGKEMSSRVRVGAAVMRDICRALSYAYELPGSDGAPLRLVHRDVSPGNIMVGYDGGVKLLDFGVAKALSSVQDQTAAGVLKGKMWYMAPERVAGMPFDHRADLFACGIVLYETLTGERLFEAQTFEAVRHLMSLPLDPPSLINPQVPEALDRICLRALERDPKKRFANGNDMAAALDEVLFDLKWGGAQLSTLIKQLFPFDEDLNPRGDATRPELEYELDSSLQTVAVRDSALAGEEDKTEHDLDPLETPAEASGGSPAAVAAPRDMPDSSEPPSPSWQTDPTSRLKSRTPNPALERTHRGTSYARVAFWLFIGMAGPIAISLARHWRSDASAPIQVDISSQPEGAEFTLSGAPPLSGRTPFHGRIPRSEQARTLRVTMKGHQSAELVLRSSSEISVTIILRTDQTAPAPASALGSH